MNATPARCGSGGPLLSPNADRAPAAPRQRQRDDTDGRRSRPPGPARTQRTARKRGRQPATSTRLLAGWLLVVTTLPAQDWPADAVLRRYRARWQVEPVVTRVTQLLRVRPRRCMVFEEILRSRPRRRASPCPAKGVWSLEKYSAQARAGGLRLARPRAYGLWRNTPLSPAQAGFALPGRGRMVFGEILRSRPRRRASPCLAEGVWSLEKYSALARAGGLRIP